MESYNNKHKMLLIVRLADFSISGQAVVKKCIAVLLVCTLSSAHL
jgi:hypothetical protein